MSDRIVRVVNDLLAGLAEDNAYGFDVRCVEARLKGSALSLNYLGVSITAHGSDEYVVSTWDCTDCGAYHLNCRDVEAVCKDFDEVMETAVMYANDYGR